MNPFSRLTSVYSSHWYQRFLKQIEPLDRFFSINLCGYTLVTNEGKYFQLYNHPELCDYYYGNKFYLENPFHYHPSNYVTGSILPYSLNLEGFRKTHDDMEVRWGVNANYLMIQRKKEGLAHSFSFSTTHKDIPIVNIYLNNLRVIERFVDFFIDEWDPENGVFDEYSVNMPDLIGNKFYKDLKQTIYQSGNGGEKHIEFLKHLKLIGNEKEIYATFTKREKECLHLMLSGHTASEMGEVLDLSRRTTENYLESIRGKLDCDCKSEVFRRFYELKIMGLLID